MISLDFLQPDTRGGCILQFIALVGAIVLFVIVCDMIFASLWGAH